MSQEDRRHVERLVKDAIAAAPTGNSLQDILHKDGSFTFDNTTDSLEALADSLATAAELAKVPKSDATVTWNATALASVNAEVDTALNTAVPLTPTANSLNDILSKLDGANTYDNTTDSLEALADTLATAAELAKVPKSDSTVSWNATALAAINAEVDTALNTALAQPPTANSVSDILHKDGSYTYDNTTDSLEAIRDKIDISPAVSLASATTTGVIVQDGATGTANVVTVTTDTTPTANTFGAWAQLDASVSADSWVSHVCVTLTDTGGTAQNLCVEIGTGASPATKLRFSWANASTSNAGINPILTFALPIPMKVASGTKISARASTSYSVSVNLGIGLSMYQSLET